MNKQLINKYKPEFDHWLNGGSVLIKSGLGWCPIATEFAWSCNTSVDALLVINDEYSIYRKALAEGKTIQLNGTAVNGGYGETWNDCAKENLFIYGINTYRIKPDEPKFKVGDFVRYVYSTPARALEINNINGNRYYFTNSEMSCMKHELELWTPVKGEWCWFYDSKSSKFAALAQFKEINNDYFMSITDASWKYCEPFLNSLPSYLKDK